MEFQDLSKEQLIDIIHRQADDLAALQLELEFVKQAQNPGELQPVYIDGNLYSFRLTSWMSGGKKLHAVDVMKDEAALRAIVANPHQMILKRIQ